MTHPHHTRALGATGVETAANDLRSRGLRFSTARRLLLEALFAAGRPLTAEQLAAGIDGRMPRSDLASVYRNLEVLEELGLVRHVHLGHGPGLYGPATSVEVEYVACHGCGAF